MYQFNNGMKHFGSAKGAFERSLLCNDLFDDRYAGDLRRLNLSNNYLFTKVMEDRELCRRILEEILQISIRKVVLVNTEESIRHLPDRKGIRMDVYVNDDEGTIYNVEMQTGNDDNLPKRARYYQGTIDLDRLLAGGNYAELKKTYIIFICTFPLFGMDRHIYTFENICEEDPLLRLDDGTTKIFLSTCGKLDDISRELTEFLYYVENTTVEVAEGFGSPLVLETNRRVQEVKDTRKYQVEYMNLYMYEKEVEGKARESGRAAAKEEDIAYMAEFLMQENQGLNRDEAIAKATAALLREDGSF